MLALTAAFAEDRIAATTFKNPGCMCYDRYARHLRANGFDVSVLKKPNMTAIKAEARKNGMLYMREEGLRLVVKGITSIDELLRVVK